MWDDPITLLSLKHKPVAERATGSTQPPAPQAQCPAGSQHAQGLSPGTSGLGGPQRAPASPRRSQKVPASPVHSQNILTLQRWRRQINAGAAGGWVTPVMSLRKPNAPKLWSENACVKANRPRHQVDSGLHHDSSSMLSERVRISSLRSWHGTITFRARNGYY